MSSIKTLHDNHHGFRQITGITLITKSFAMNPIISTEEHQVIGTVKYEPAVSVILPFEPVMSSKSELEYRLKMAIAKVEKELALNYPAEKAIPVIIKLHKLFKSINYNTRKKSIAVFASPVVEKIFYLDIPVSEKIVIDESFEIRDLVYSKKQTIQYLILLLSAESSKMYLGNCSKFALIKSNGPDNVYAYKNDAPERVANFSDPQKRKEQLLDKFLQHMDQGLSIILKAYPLPVFVIGAERVVGHFKKITHNLKSIVQTIHGNYMEATEPEIRQLMQPYTANWKKIKEQALLQQLEKAYSFKKLVFGMEQVWAASVHKNSMLLVVEKDFMFPAHLGDAADKISREDLGLNHPFYIKDAVDDAIEKVLEAGGDVEFVDSGVLKDYEHIALIQYYE